MCRFLFTLAHFFFTEAKVCHLPSTALLVAVVDASRLLPMRWVACAHVTAGGWLVSVTAHHDWPAFGMRCFNFTSTFLLGSHLR
jgi:hypothetical protein